MSQFKDEEPEQPRSPERWDYSRHPLGAGGMQLRAVFWGVVGTLALGALILLLLVLLQRSPGQPQYRSQRRTHGVDALPSAAGRSPLLNGIAVRPTAGIRLGRLAGVRL